jgi:hypothetical protein
MNPPREIAPDHKEGCLCRIQRCTGCIHGVVFIDSLQPLSRAYAELIFLKGQVPYVAWSDSSFEDEYDSLSETLKLFPPDQVEFEVEHWLRKLEAGEIICHDTYPSY